jgi:hypothetical protein
MALARKLYDLLDEAPDDRARFRLIVDAIGQLEERWPDPGEIARGTDVREAELQLEVRLAEMQKENKETELRLHKEILRSRNDLLKWLVPLMPAQVAAIATLVKLL